MDDKIIKKIKSINWDNRVRRIGYLQSKAICIDAEMQPIKLTGKTSVKYTSEFWVNEINLYDENQTKSFTELFNKAFYEDKNWPIKIADKLDFIKIELKKFITVVRKFNKNNSKSKNVFYFRKYVDLLMKVQKYYVIAVPLTDYCENKIRKLNIDPLTYAKPIKKLDIEKFENSLVYLARQYKKNNLKLGELIKNHINKYYWIKAAYNEIIPYSDKDVYDEIKLIIDRTDKKSVVKNRKTSYLIKGMQAGIYLRNRIKELSQQIWTGFEPLAVVLANGLNLSRDDFFQLLSGEVINSIKKGNSVVSAAELKKRHSSFIYGFLNNKKVLICGEPASALYDFFNKVQDKSLKVFSGAVASPGIATGKSKVVLSSKEFDKIKNGDILVASMTTPEYVSIMKKAAAIITDEGGLSCHAAIVARELKIPCVIGTKIATKVLKDGDKVEVDANRGVVKIIK